MLTQPYPEDDEPRTMGLPSDIVDQRADAITTRGLGPDDLLFATRDGTPSPATPSAPASGAPPSRPRGSASTSASTTCATPTPPALATVSLPQRLHWSGPSRPFRLRDRGDRARVYEIVLREGEPADLLTYVDGALLVDLWDELVLPTAIRRAWEPAVSPYGETP